MNVYAFPYAGGDGYCYRRLREHLPAALQFRTLELPGRGRRIREPLKTGLLDMVEDAVAFVGRPPAEPYLLFGHSMGAALAFETARQIVAKRQPPPVHLVVSGRAAPCIPSHKRRRDLPGEQFRAALRELGACPEEVLNNSELMEYFEPVLRADFQAIEEYISDSTDRLPFGITVLTGDQDDVTEEEALAWGKRTSGPFRVQRFPGDHFFLFPHAPALGRLFLEIARIPPANLVAP